MARRSVHIVLASGAFDKLNQGVDTMERDCGLRGTRERKREAEKPSHLVWPNAEFSS